MTNLQRLVDLYSIFPKCHPTGELGAHHSGLSYLKGLAVGTVAIVGRS